MKKISISVSYDEEKLTALKLYLEQKGTQVEQELGKALDVLYLKNVPASVRGFFDLRSGAASYPSPKGRKLKTDKSAEDTMSEVSDNGR